MKKTHKLIIASISIFMVLLGFHVANAIECLRPPLPEALDALTSSATVAVSVVEVDSWDGATPAPEDDKIYYAFMPKKTPPTVGFIILPGGNCDPRSYAPAAHAIAAKGFFTCIIPMPSCIAMFGYTRADKIIEDYGNIETWAIGGHSVGGTAAGNYAVHSDTISGVVIWASLADPSSKLNETALKVLSVYGSLDGRATPEQVIENAVVLPADTVFVEIEGGNHTQFGWIDPSPNAYLELDNAATITIEEQQEIIVQVTSDFLKQFNTQLGETHPPMPEALEAMESDFRVEVETVEVAEWEEGSNFYFAFKPKHTRPKIGFIFYPGGLVDPQAYAPPARAIAAKGYLVVIVKMKGDLAVLSADRADRVISDFSEIKTWIIGGHSIGGSFACYYAHEHAEKLDGVVLWAAWPSEGFRLDDTDLKAISIYGTNDGHPDEIKAGAEHLPEGTPFVEIEGGNHTQIGYYWDGVNEDYVQPGDNPADISREEQQRIMIQSTLDFLKQFNGNVCPASFLLGADTEGIATLRTFRDAIMAKSAFGKKLIALYYAHGKSMTAFLDHNPSMKYAARKALESLIPLTKIMTAL